VPAAPPLPAQPAIRRDKPDESAPSRLYRRSKPPPTLESMRLPLAFRLSKMRLMEVACGVAMLAGVSVITGEAASLAYENLIFQRTRPAAEAERDLARVQIDRTARTEAATR
jgi:hypothetical protein